MIYYLSAYTHFNLIHLWLKKWARENALGATIIVEIPGQLWRIPCSEEQMDALNQVLQAEVPITALFSSWPRDKRTQKFQIR